MNTTVFPDVGPDSVRSLRTRDVSELQKAMKELKERESLDDELLGELIALAFGHREAKVRSKAKVFCKAHLDDYEEISKALKQLTRQPGETDTALAELGHRLTPSIARGLVFHDGTATGTAFMVDAEIRQALLELNVASSKEEGDGGYLSLNVGLSPLQQPRFYTFHDAAVADICAAAQRVKAHRLILDNNIHCEDLPDSFARMAPWLTHLSMGNACLTTVPSGVLACTKLETLELWGVDLLDVPDLSVLPSLKELTLSRAPKLKSLPVGVTKSKTIHTLNISETKIAKLPASIGEMSSLTKLMMPRTKLKKLPKEIVNCPITMIVAGADKLDIDAAKKLFLDAGKTVDWRVY